MRTYICVLIIFFVFIGITNLRYIREGLDSAPCLDASSEILFNQNANLLDTVQGQVSDFISKVTEAEKAIAANKKAETDNYNHNNDVMNAICPTKCIELEKHWSKSEQIMKCQAACCTFTDHTFTNTCTNPWNPTPQADPPKTASSQPSGYKDPEYKAPPPSAEAKEKI